MKLGTENRKQTIAAAALGGLLLVILVWEFWPSSSTSASTVAATPVTADLPQSTPAAKTRSVPRSTTKSAPAGKEKIPQNLDPTLHLAQLTATEQIQYEGTGRNIFVAQSEAEIPKPLAPGQTDPQKPQSPIYVPPSAPVSQPIPLKFFGFANQPGEPKKVFLSKGDDIFIAGEGEIVDRRYKVVKISATSVEVQDVVNSGPPQSLPLAQGNPT